MENKKRIGIIDETRGALIALVILYHCLYNLHFIFKIEWAQKPFDIYEIFQPLLPFSFILISGISFGFSRSNLRRGLRLAVIAASISLVMWFFMREQMIWFGVLHLLALMNIILSFFKPQLQKLPLIPTAAICLALFFFTYHIQRGYLGFENFLRIELPPQLYQHNFLAVFGIHSNNFFSSDYIPILPWSFPFFIGIALSKKAERLPDALKRTHCRALAFLGRHTLLIYLVHQPIIFGIMWLVFRNQNPAA